MRWHRLLHPGDPPAGDPPADPPPADPPADPPPAPADWKAGLSEDIRGHAALAEVGTVQDLASMWVNVQPRIGMDKLAIPASEDAEGWDAVHKALGRPDEPTGYVAPEAGMPEGVELNEELLKTAYERFHRLGISKRQGAELVRLQAEMVANEIQQANQATATQREESITALKQEFGASFDESLALAKQAVTRFGGEDLVKMLEETGLGDEPAVVKAFVNIGRSLASDEILGTGVQREFILTPAQATQELEKLQNDPEFGAAWRNKEHKRHQEVTEKFERLNKMANPDAPVTEPF